MADVLDMSLDDMIKKSRSDKKSQRGGRGRRGGRGGRVRTGRVPIQGGGTAVARGRGTRVNTKGPLRVNVRPVNTRSSALSIAKTFGRGKDVAWQHDLFEDSLVAAGYSGIETGTKLYVSNLDLGVTNDDIKELFSEIGDVKRYSVHYDSKGRPNGSAEVVYTRKVDAVAAMKRYNGVQLDGKSMKIENIGTSLGLPFSGRVNLNGGANGRGKRTVVMGPRGTGRARDSVLPSHGISKSTRGRSQRGGRGREVGGRSQGRRGGRKKPVLKSADDLNKDLESYHAEAMNTS